MKLGFSLLLILILNSCDAQNNTDSIFLKYEAITRGSFIEITSNLDSLIYKDTKESKEIKRGRNIQLRSVHAKNILANNLRRARKINE